MSKRLVTCLSCGEVYWLDHFGPLKSYETCPYGDCEGRRYAARRRLRKQGHSALRAKDGKLEKFDPHPYAQPSDSMRNHERLCATARIRHSDGIGGECPGCEDCNRLAAENLCALTPEEQAIIAKLRMGKRLVTCNAVDRPHSFSLCNSTEGHAFPKLVATPPVPQEAAPKTCLKCGKPMADTQVRCLFCDAYEPAPDEAMRVAREIDEMLGYDNLFVTADEVQKMAALIRQAGSDEITKLRADYNREHKWLNDAASEANSDLDSVASVIWKLREAGSERERELARALSAAIPFLFEHGSHQNNNCYRGSDDGCYCGLDEAKKLIKLAEASRLLGGETK